VWTAIIRHLSMRFSDFLSDRAINRVGRSKKLRISGINDSEGIREDGADKNEDPA